MPKIKRKKHEVEAGKDEDVELKTGPLRVYFQNKYSLISLINDVLLGLAYTVASVGNLLGWPSIYSTYLYVVGALFLLLRPVFQIMRNVSIYKDKDYIKDDYEDEADDEEKDAEYNAEYDDENHNES